MRCRLTLRFGSTGISFAATLATLAVTRVITRVVTTSAGVAHQAFADPAVLSTSKVTGDVIPHACADLRASTIATPTGSTARIAARGRVVDPLVEVHFAAAAIATTAAATQPGTPSPGSDQWTALFPSGTNRAPVGPPSIATVNSRSTSTSAIATANAGSATGNTARRLTATRRSDAAVRFATAIGNATRWFNVTSRPHTAGRFAPAGRSNSARWFTAAGWSNPAVRLNTTR